MVSKEGARKWTQYGNKTVEQLVPSWLQLMVRGISVSCLSERVNISVSLLSVNKHSQNYAKKKRGEIFVLILSIFYSFSAGAEKKGEEVG